MREPAGLRGNARPSTDEIAPVWVLDDPQDAMSDRAIAVAERLGVPHLRVPLAWSWRAPFLRLGTHGSLRGLAGSGTPPWPFSAPRGPALAIAAGAVTEPVSLWLRSTFATRVVHCSVPPGGRRMRQFDMLVVPRHEHPPSLPNVLPVLGVPHRLSPLLLSQARVAWAGRLSHLPRPLIALLVGGGPDGHELRPVVANRLGHQVSQLALRYGGSVLATTTRRTGMLATAALTTGLAPCMHLLYRWGEPGENTYAGMLALADAIVVTGSSATMISEACSTEAPVFIASRAENAGMRRLHNSLYMAGQARPLRDSIGPWDRVPLDEAGRVATAIRARMSIGPQAVD